MAPKYPLAALILIRRGRHLKAPLSSLLLSFQCDIPVISYSWTQAHIAARDIVQEKSSTIGVDVERDEDGDVREVVLASTCRIYRISLSDLKRGGLPENALTAILAGQKPDWRLVAFDMAPIALGISSIARTTIRGVELKATLGDLRMSPSEIFKKSMPSSKVKAFEFDQLWAHNSYAANASSLRAWLSACIGEHCKQAVATTSYVVDTSYVVREELILLAKLLREVYIIAREAPHEIQSEFTAHEVGKDGRLLLQNSRYKTRVRASKTGRVAIKYTNEETSYGRSTRTRGRQSEIKLKRGVGGRVIESISVVGAQSNTAAEHARDEFVLDVCCGRKPGLQSYAFIRHLFFPIAEELLGEIPNSLHQKSIYGLNMSQSQVVASMVHSPRPCTIVHGPPGTGKTKTISAAVEVWAAHGRATWAVAHSNIAVKNIAEGIARRGVDFRLIVSQDFYVDCRAEPDKLIFVALRHEAIYHLIVDKLIRSDEFPPDTGSLKRMMGDACVILSTVSMLSNPKLHLLKMFTDVMPVERLVIDEASQINVFEYMPLCAKFKKLSKICFFGDPKQLPPFGKEAASTIQCIFDLSHLNRFSHFLDTQYRMPVPLGNFVSRHVYGGRLKSQHDIIDHSCITFVDARGGCGEETQGRSKINRDEVQVARNLVAHYHQHKKNFCVITPYDAQRAEIARELGSVDLPSDCVFNVDTRGARSNALRSNTRTIDVYGEVMNGSLVDRNTRSNHQKRAAKVAARAAAHQDDLDDESDEEEDENISLSPDPVQQVDKAPQAVPEVVRNPSSIVTTLLDLLSTALRTSGISVELPSVRIPRDVRTAARAVHGVEPEIDQTVCCPKCFYLHPRPVPWTCSWRESARSRPCGEHLWTERKTRHGPKWVPRRLYHTQNFDTWVPMFLSRKVITDSLVETQQYCAKRWAPGSNHDNWMRDVHDSPAWRELYGSSYPSPYNLVFGIYVDWFNQFTNKIAGKVASCGVIILFCLNLAPHLRYRPENTFIVGITPPPNAPSAVTISHILHPFVACIRKYDSAVGSAVLTFKHPEGVYIRVKLAPLMADLLASKKFGGFGSPAHRYLCSHCLCPADEIEITNIAAWPKRDGAVVRGQAEAWLKEATKSGRDALFKSTGVRWTPLHMLKSYDPVKHVMLGFMHNTLEGLLQTHLRSRWKLGEQSSEKARTSDLVDEDERWTEDASQESAAELEDLFDAVNPTARAALPEMQIPRTEEAVTRKFAHPYLFDYDDDDDDDDDTDYIPPAASAFRFTDPQIQQIRDAIRDISLPSCVERPPLNLGEPSHGKLKAEYELTLFTLIFPLFLPEFWLRAGSTDHDQLLLSNFYHLVAATNIVSSFSTTASAADEYTYHYTQYRISSTTLFPDSTSKPNHHYAMHNADLLRYWGPLPVLSEFAGERMNADLSLTMMKQSSRSSRLEALLQDNSADSAVIREFGSILQSTDITNSPIEPAKLSRFTEEEYAALLSYLRGTGRPYRAFEQFPHPKDALVLAPWKQDIQTHGQDKYLYSCQRSNLSNSAVYFYNPSTGTCETGLIQDIWQVELGDSAESDAIFLSIGLHSSLSAADDARGGYIHRPGFLTRLVSTTLSAKVIVEPQHLRTQLTMLKRPRGAYGIDKEFYTNARSTRGHCQRVRKVHADGAPTERKGAVVRERDEQVGAKEEDGGMEGGEVEHEG
ncbi:hypothetical protein HDZ31DRAFT_75655 [Schizophyllum fasciatum]